MFLETSALTGENVEEAFLKCARTILNKIESGRSLNEPGGSRVLAGTQGRACLAFVPWGELARGAQCSPHWMLRGQPSPLRSWQGLSPPALQQCPHSSPR